MRIPRRTFLASTVGFLPILNGCIGGENPINRDAFDDDSPGEKESKGERSDDHWLDRADLGFAVGQNDCAAPSFDVSVEDVTVSVGGATALKVRITEVTSIRIFDPRVMEISGYSRPSDIDVPAWEFDPEPDTTRDTFPIQNIWFDCTEVIITGSIKTDEDIEDGQHTFNVGMADGESERTETIDILVEEDKHGRTSR